MKKAPKIFIIEDNPYNLKLYKEVFSAHGFEVLSVETIEGDLPGIIAECDPDIISMDLMLQGSSLSSEVDGFEAIERLKGDLRTYEIPIVVLTSFFEDKKVQRAKELGVVDFITVSGLEIQKVPETFLRYLDNPKRYKPVHPLFRKGT